MKKKLSLSTIICASLSTLILILALFSLVKIKGFIFDLLFTLLTLTVSGILLINSYDAFKRNNKLGYANISLILSSSLLVILCFWTKLDNLDWYKKATLSISILSVCFNLISSSVLKLTNRYKIIQILSYACYFILSLLIIFTSLDILKSVGTLIALFAILSFFAFCVLTVLSKKQIDVNYTTTSEYVKIPKKEYEELLSCKEKLNKLLEEKNSND